MNKVRNIFIFSIILVVIAVSVYAFVFIMIRAENIKISELRGDINTVLGKEQQLKSSQNIVSDTESVRRELDSYFISKGGVVDFLEKIESFGSDANVLVEVKSVEIEAIGESKLIDHLNIIVSAEGDWSDVFYFLNLIESQPFSISTNRMNLEESSKGEEWRLNLDFNVLKIK